MRTAMVQPMVTPMVRGIASGVLDPLYRALFATGAKGVFYNPSDFSTLFQDSAGTTPVTALGQPVGKQLDLSGNGFHRTQSTAASRPTIEARVNLLTKSESFTESPWSPTRLTVTSVAGIFVDGTAAHRIQETATTGLHYIGAGTLGVSEGVDTEIFVDAKAGERTKIGIYRSANSGGAMFDLATGLVSVIHTSTIGAASGTDAATATDASIAPLGDGWYRCKLRRKASSTQHGSHYISVDTDYQSGQAGDVTKGLYIKRAQLAFTSDPFRNVYQRVNTATDYTDIGAPRYLMFDGVDDWMETAAIDFTGTDAMTVWAGIRKSSDAAAGVVLELSSTLVSNNGTFHVLAPVGASPSVVFRSKGTGAGLADASTGYPAPLSCVVSGIGKISTDTAILRINGAQAASSVVDQGVVSYGNYKLYFGRRGGTTSPFKGRDYGIIICGKTASASELTNYEQWINTRMGRIY